MRFNEHFSVEELEILRVRAERLANSGADSRRKEQSALCVMIGYESYALSIDSLAAVYEAVNVVEVPCAPAHIAGVANVRGHIIPVLRIADLLGITVAENEAQHIVVATYKDAPIGMAVSRVGDIINYAAEDITPLGSEANRWIQGLLADGTALLHIDTLLGDPVLLVQDTGLS